MSRLWGQVIALFVIVVAFNILLSNAVQASAFAQIVLGILTLVLLGSGVLAVVADVDKWRDKGVVLGTVWGGSGAVVSTWIFGVGVWSHGAGQAQTGVGALLSQLSGTVFAIDCAASTVGNAMPLRCRSPDLSQIPSMSFGSLIFPIIIDLAILSIGMAIVGLPIYLVIRLTRQRKPATQK